MASIHPDSPIIPYEKLFDRKTGKPRAMELRGPNREGLLLPSRRIAAAAVDQAVAKALDTARNGKSTDDAPRSVQEESARFSEFSADCVRERDGSRLDSNLPSVRLIDDSYVFAWKNRVNLCLVAIPGLFKTTRARGLLAYAIGTDPSIRGTVISAEKPTATRIVSSVRNIIESPSYKKWFPRVVIDSVKSRSAEAIQGGFGNKTMANQQSMFYLVNTGASPDPALEAVAYEPTGEMRRVDLGLFDDMESRALSYSAAKRDSVYRAFYQTWLDGRLRGHPNNGTAIVINNLWDGHGLPVKLRGDSRFASLWIGISEDLTMLEVRGWNLPENHPALTPCLYNGIQAEPLKDEQIRFFLPKPPGSSLSTASLQKVRSTSPFFPYQFRLQESSPSDQMFRAWATSPGRFAGTLPDYFRCETRSGGKLFWGTRPASVRQLVWSCDFSSSKRPGDTLMLMALLQSGAVMPLEIHYGNFTASHRVATIQEAYQRGLRPDAVVLEDAGLQDALINEVKEAAKRGRVDWASCITSLVTTGIAKKDPEDGLPSVALAVENGGILFADGEREPGRPFVEGFSRFNTEMETCKRLMPGYMTPDGVMTLWFGWRYLKESSTFQYAGGFVPQSFDEGNALGGSFDGDGRDDDDY